MSASPNDLQALREAIDEIDEQIQDLINQRIKHVQQVAKAKQHDAANPVYYHPDREALVLKKLCERNQGPLPNEDMCRIYKDIMSISLALQHKLSISYLGPEGSFSHLAAVKQFGYNFDLTPTTSIPEVFTYIEQGKAQLGIVPVENTLGGMVEIALESFANTTLKICAEMTLDIQQNLLIKEPDIVIKTIYSHEQGFRQCDSWLKKHYPTAKRISVASTAEAARALSNDPNGAAIASELAAQLYDLHPAVFNIGGGSQTRFAIIGQQETKPTGNDKTTLIVDIKENTTSEIETLLDGYSQKDYLFTAINDKQYFIEIPGHHHDNACEQLLKSINSQIDKLINLGSYPKAIA